MAVNSKTAVRSSSAFGESSPSARHAPDSRIRKNSDASHIRYISYGSASTRPQLADRLRTRRRDWSHSSRSRATIPTSIPLHALAQHASALQTSRAGSLPRAAQEPVRRAPRPPAALAGDEVSHAWTARAISPAQARAEPEPLELVRRARVLPRQPVQVPAPEQDLAVARRRPLRFRHAGWVCAGSRLLFP